MTRDAGLKFCPRCASGLVWRPAGDTAEVAEHPTCSNCGFVLWQNPKPSVEGLIVRNVPSGTEILLGRLASGEGWDLPGNFLNVGDRLEEALIRECRREMGIDVNVEGILGAFEDTFLGGPTISLVYVCSIRGGERRPAAPIEDVRWFPLGDPPELAFHTVKRAIEALRAQIASR